MVVANNTRSKTTPRVGRLQKQCVSLSAKGSSRRCKAASARMQRNYQSPADEVLRALAPELGSFNFITPMQRSGGHVSTRVDVEQCKILFPSPKCEMSRTVSVRISNDSPLLSASDGSVVLNPDGDDPPTVSTVTKVPGGSLAPDGEVLTAAEESPTDHSGEFIPHNEDKGGLTFKDYPPQPPDDSSLFSDWLLNVPLPFGENNPPLTISLINRVDYRLSHLSS